MYYGWYTWLFGCLSHQVNLNQAGPTQEVHQEKLASIATQTCPIEFNPPKGTYIHEETTKQHCTCLPKNHFGSEGWLGMIQFFGSAIAHKILVGGVHTRLKITIPPAMELFCQDNPGWHGGAKCC